MMTSEEFVREINSVARDSIRESEFARKEFNLTLDDMKRAFKALKEHKEGLGDLFEDTEAPTDEAMLLIFAFLVLP